MKEDQKNCIFCKILKGDLEVSMLYEDDQCAAFMDIQPINPGHALVIPKEHIPYTEGLDEELGAHLFKIGLRINKALRSVKSIRCEGVNYFLADGEAALQEIFHTHLHIFPRFTGDGFGLRYGEMYDQLPPRNELDSLAKEIRSRL